ncbi:type II 3-dehydroquinate dehydratase [uncultured Cohaesibacter sp.]|uniref:type II 3-dehydroquinate dehydratase n=1 Tax=uncultured Cohaesibacter sp. TaxID=1002546 RepID=UPI0029C90D7B|nr:type II 3-dehydroquinate dehydratase [uncultured Cohaesibacter sp.]
MTQVIYVLNGPNLNLLGQREPGIYGATTLEDIKALCLSKAEELGLSIEFLQSNHEGQLVDWIQEAGQRAAGIVFNPAAYSHTSVALQDAIRAVQLPVMEVHLSNIHARESFRHHSFIAPVAKGVICGLGPYGYVVAIEALANYLKQAAKA